MSEDVKNEQSKGNGKKSKNKGKAKFSLSNFFFRSSTRGKKEVKSEWDIDLDNIQVTVTGKDGIKYNLHDNKGTDNNEVPDTMMLFIEEPSRSEMIQLFNKNTEEYEKEEKEKDEESLKKMREESKEFKDFNVCEDLYESVSENLDEKACKYPKSPRKNYKKRERINSMESEYSLASAESEYSLASAPEVISTTAKSKEKGVHGGMLLKFTKPIYGLGRKFKVSGNKFKSRNGSSKQSTGKTAGSSTPSDGVQTKKGFISL